MHKNYVSIYEMIYLWNVWFMVIKGATCSLFFFLWRWCMIPIWNQILIFFKFFFWACEGSKNACYIQLVAPLKFRPFIIFLCPFGMYQYGNNLVAVLLIGFFSCFVLGCLPWQMSCSFYFFFFFFSWQMPLFLHHFPSRIHRFKMSSLHSRATWKSPEENST